MKQQFGLRLLYGSAKCTFFLYCFVFVAPTRYFQQVLVSGKLSVDGNEIQLHQDGSWSSLIVKKEQTRVLSPVVSILHLEFCKLG
jgi:hypothetical protein